MWLRRLEIVRDIRLDALDSLAKSYYSGERPIQPAANNYTKTEMVDFLRRYVADLEIAIAALNPEQLAYRLPGAPQGPDASGDEAHFNPSELATHVASGLTFHWRGIARSLGHPPPTFTRPPEGARTTGTQGNVLGAGGWDGATAPELAHLLHETSDRFLAYLDSLPPDLDRTGTMRFSTLGSLDAHGWLFLAAVHPAVHLHQLHNMQAEPDYPGGQGTV